MGKDAPYVKKCIFKRYVAQKTDSTVAQTGAPFPLGTRIVQMAKISE